MRKSNWIIAAILVAGSIIFLCLWYFLGFNLIDAPVDLVLSIVWWLLIILACVLVHVVEKRRQESIRTAFLGNNVIYNSELGIVRLDGEGQYVPALSEMLDELTYNFDHAEEPDGSRIRFQYVVRSSKFDKDGNKWEGEVVRVSKPNRPMPFSNREELAAIIDASASA